MGPQADTKLEADLSLEQIRLQLAEIAEQVDAAYKEIDNPNNPQSTDDLTRRHTNQAIAGSRLEANAEARPSAEVLDTEQIPGIPYVMAYGDALTRVRKMAVNPAPVLSTGRSNSSRKTW